MAAVDIEADEAALQTRHCRISWVMHTQGSFGGSCERVLDRSSRMQLAPPIETFFVTLSPLCSDSIFHPSGYNDHIPMPYHYGEPERTVSTEKGRSQLEVHNTLATDMLKHF